MTTNAEKPSGFIDTLTDQQSESLEELKRMINETEASEAGGINLKEEFEKHLDGDKFLLRFLRATMKDKKHARIFQATEAFEKVSKHLKWRAEMNLNRHVDEMEEPQKWELYQQVRPTYRWIDGKQETMVLCERFGYLGTHLRKDHLETEDWMACLGFNSERVAHELRSKLENEPIGIHAIIDEAGLGLGFVQRISLIKLMNGIMAEHYPETVHKVHIVNAPWIFEKLFSLVKTFLDKDTVSKIGVFSSVPSDLFRELYDVDKLPQEYGGDAEIQVPIPLDAQKFFKKLG